MGIHSLHAAAVPVEKSFSAGRYPAIGIRTTEVLPQLTLAIRSQKSHYWVLPAHERYKSRPAVFSLNAEQRLDSCPCPHKKINPKKYCPDIIRLQTSSILTFRVRKTPGYGKQCSPHPLSILRGESRGSYLSRNSTSNSCISAASLFLFLLDRKSENS
jgi:hypothetical protein